MTDAPQTSESAAAIVAERPVAPTQAFGRLFPPAIRAFVRTSELGLAVVALVIGLVSGLLVSGMSLFSQFAHEILFGLPRGQHLSLSVDLDPWRTVAAIAGGGLALAMLTRWAGTRFRGRLADAIEANALHGGRLSVGGSLFITVQTMISNGCGASVGLEAAYTQICSAFSSVFGRALGARRNDMRVLVACGAAGAIAAAFHAPLAGSFYGFEVVLGSYSVVSLVPIVGSAVAASMVAGVFVDHRLLASAPGAEHLGHGELLHMLVVALICSAVSVGLMSSVAASERLFNAVVKPAWLRPVLGGAMVAGIGLVAPAALSSGHGALPIAVAPDAPLAALLAISVLKAGAASISLGSGFRGGLFFASLFLGALIGRCYADATAMIPILPHANVNAMALVGMAGLATGIVGAPFAMTCLALEMSGDFGVTLSALIVSAIVSLVVRETFGYSFATWRFHLRGETIRGPHDIGWERDLRVARLMRHDVRTMRADTQIDEARALLPVGSTKDVMLLDSQGRYAGSLLVSDLHSTTEEATAPVSALAHMQTTFLTPGESIRHALDLFSESEADVLAVVSDPVQRKVIGQLSEAHALRRYGEELERRNRAFVER
ncbi:MAG: chloride channel protein [Hyphomicrobiales bacterium]|nr:chloride channel protein [Hyphomicrobiales bacterium]